jgi:hypothetical protein
MVSFKYLCAGCLVDPDRGVGGLGHVPRAEAEAERRGGGVRLAIPARPRRGGGWWRGPAADRRGSSAV